MRSGDQFATVTVHFLVGRATPLLPSAPTFTASDHADAGTIAVTFGTRPDTSDRRIRVVQYSTDSGTTWRRLCNGWTADTHKITVASNGTPITPGNYTLRLRLNCDWDYASSPASAPTSVTVT